MLLVRSGGGARLCLVERLDARPRGVSEVMLSTHSVVGLEAASVRFVRTADVSRVVAVAAVVVPFCNGLKS